MALAVDIRDVQPILVTRGDVPIMDILESIPIEVLVWNNSLGEDLKVYGRYKAIEGTSKPYIYFQDDDAICPFQQLVEMYEGEGLLLNVPEDEKSFVGWGAIFSRDLPAEAFARYSQRWPLDDTFLLTADFIFVEMTPHTRVDLGHVDLPWATAENRMFLQRDHYNSQKVARSRAAGEAEHPRTDSR